MGTAMDKIKKLLALSQSHNENEAAVALAQAMKLAAAHGMDIKDIEATGQEQIIEEDVAKYRQSIPRWESRFSCCLAEFLGCRIVFSCRRSRCFRRESKVVAVGFSSDLEIFIYIHEYLLKTMKRLAAEKTKELPRDVFASPSRLRRSILQGISDAVLVKAKGVFGDKATNEEQEQYAVILKRGGLVDVHLQAIPEARNGRESAVDHAAYVAGYRAGEAIPINKGIEAAQEARQALKTTALLN